MTKRIQRPPRPTGGKREGAGRPAWSPIGAKVLRAMKLSPELDLAVQQHMRATGMNFSATMEHLARTALGMAIGQATDEAPRAKGNPAATATSA